MHHAFDVRAINKDNCNIGKCKYDEDFLFINDFELNFNSVPVKVWSHDLLKSYDVRIEAQTRANVTYDKGYMIYI